MVDYPSDILKDELRQTITQRYPWLHELGYSIKFTKPTREGSAIRAIVEPGGRVGQTFMFEYMGTKHLNGTSYQWVTTLAPGD